MQLRGQMLSDHVQVIFILLNKNVSYVRIYSHLLQKMKKSIEIAQILPVQSDLYCFLYVSLNWEKNLVLRDEIPI